MRFAFALLSLAICCPSFAQIPQYTIVDLGPCPGFTLETSPALNDHGHAAFGTGGLISHWQNGAATSLPQSNGGFARGISNSGLIVGWTSNGAAVWHNGVYTSLVPLIPNAPIQSQAVGINNQNHIIANTNLGSNSRAYLINGQTATNLGSFGGLVISADVNENDQVVGHAFVPNQGIRAFLWDNGNLMTLGTLGGNSLAYGINNDGLIVGSYEALHPINNFRAFQYSNGQMTALSDLPGILRSEAFAVNDARFIVGATSLSGLGSRATIWRNNEVRDLNSLLLNGSGWSLHLASAINASGQIVGTGEFNGQQRAFLLNPIPGPSAMALFALAVQYQRRRR